MIIYKSAGEALVNKTSAGTACTVNLCLVDHVDTDQWQYNRPTADEVTHVFISENVEPSGHCYIVVHGREGGPKVVSSYSAHCDLVMYLLLYSYGELGCYRELMHNSGRRQRFQSWLTSLQFITYRIIIREKFFQQHFIRLHGSPET
jgi:hypothetical protein